MKNQRYFLFTLLATLTLVCFQATAVSQTANDKLANMVGGGSSVKLDMLVSNSGSTLIVSAPDGRTFRREFKRGASPEFSIIDNAGERLPDGVYTYELRLNSLAMPGVLEKARSTRSRDDDSEENRTSRKRLNLPNVVQSGSFAIVNGGVVVAGAVEDSRRTPMTSLQLRVKERFVANTLAKLRHHRTFTVPFDDVIPDDLIVQGSACVGLDCVDGEVFGFDTVRLKENNTRLQFDDTSTSQGFPTNNWQIRANDSGSGGGSFLGIVDQSTTGNSETGTIIGRFDAGAPANSLRVSSNGKVGLRTATPVLDLHITTSDTPAHRLEQTNAGGFTAQTWDIAGNEANFFVRDVTGGSLLPFRIRPGAPTSSVDISANGDVGVGTATPDNKLHVFKATAGVVTANSNAPLVIENNNAAYINFLTPNANESGILFGNVANNAAGGILYNSSTANGLQFRVNGNSTKMIIDSAGNVGIATTAPTDTLSVNGTASKPGGGSWAVFSDERLKNIKGRFNTGLNALMKLQPLRYQYKPDNALGLKFDRENVGFSANALREAIPEAVTTGSNGYLMVNNDPILWTMLNAIKEQQKEIQELKTQVRRLQNTSRRRRR